MRLWALLPAPSPRAGLTFLGAACRVSCRVSPLLTQGTTCALTRSFSQHSFTENPQLSG